MKEKQNILVCVIAAFMPFFLYGQSDLDLNSIDLNSIDLSGADSGGGDQPDEDDPLTEIRGEVGALQAKINRTVKDFGAAKPNEQLKRLDETIAQLEEALAQTEETGPLGKTVKQHIEESEATMKRLRKQAADPLKSQKQRTRYERLADDYEADIKTIYNAENALYKARKNMMEQLKLVEEDKEYIGDVLALHQGRKAIQGLVEIAAKFNTIADSFSKITDDIVKETIPGPGVSGNN
jgi:chromosome segregation ATPase